ncbi:hypothetical protein OB920_00780 [Halobacteria archaeon HArc-gm2]|nr:hypothetical protein [Halobacteria archaeon HArc-gm2]
MSALRFELDPPPDQRGDADGPSRRRIHVSGRFLLIAAVVLVCSTPAAGALTAADRTVPGAIGSDEPNSPLATSGPVFAQSGSSQNESGTATDTASATTTTAATATTTTETSAPASAESPSDTETSEPTATSTESPTATDSPTATATTTSSTATAGTVGTSSSTPESAFVVSDVSAPAAVRAGDEVTVTATVTNAGTADATARVNYSLAGRTATSERLSLDAGESTRVTFTGGTAELGPGTYVHGVRNATGAGVAQRLRVTPDVDLTVQKMAAPTEISRGDPYVVLGTVDNPAESAITRNVSYAFDGVAIATKRVTVAGGESERVAFEIRPDRLERAAGAIANGSTHTHAVVADGGSRDGGEVLVRRGAGADPSALAVQQFRASDDLRPGETMTVNVSVLNVADAAFEGQIAYRVNGSAVDTAWVRVPVDERRTITFTVPHDALDRRDVLATPGETDHGVWVGETALQSRPLTVHGPFETETATAAATFTDSDSRSNGARGDSDGSSTGQTDTESCQRGILTPCGGTGLDETTLTLIGIATSVIGILYEMTNG